MKSYEHKETTSHYKHFSIVSTESILVWKALIKKINKRSLSYMSFSSKSFLDLKETLWGNFALWITWQTFISPYDLPTLYICRNALPQNLADLYLILCAAYILTFSKRIIIFSSILIRAQTARTTRKSQKQKKDQILHIYSHPKLLV